MPRPRLILASTSRYRRELLPRLRLPFDVRRARGRRDAARRRNARATLAQRLALAKAHAVAAARPRRGRDRLRPGGRPRRRGASASPATTRARSRSCARCAAARVVFQTAVAVVCAATGFAQRRWRRCTVRFRELSDAEIEHYLRAEQPYDCAGSAKTETLGIALLEAIESRRPDRADRPAADPHLRAAARGRHRPARRAAA